MTSKLRLLAAGVFLAAVSAGYGQPVITNQPQTQAVAPGTTAAFTVGASGTAPLAYQWQRNLGAGFSDLADRTNAVLVLSNAQPWDAMDYRVVVTNLSGGRTSAVARLYVMSPALLTNRLVIDNFDDNTPTGWTPLYGAIFETNQQFTVHGYWPGVITWEMPDTFAGGYRARSWSLSDGQTLEWRAELVGLNQGADAADLEYVNPAINGAYVFIKGRDFIHLNKVTVGGGWNVGHVFHEMALIPNTNVVLAFAQTRATPNLILTLRILDKANHNAVLYERSVVDTPNADPTLTQAELYAASGMHMNTGSDILAPPWTSFGYVGLLVWQYNYDGNQPPADAKFDNLELWTYRVPIPRYVDANSANPMPPYTNWVTAAMNIQDAVDVAVAGDEIIVTNGLYATGGRAVGTNVLVNRVAVDKPLTLRSVNGPRVTSIVGTGPTGSNAVRCVYLTNGAVLSGFTLTNGVAEASGGGVWCESSSAVVSNCVLTGNSASSYGGGASGGTLNNCTLTGNSAVWGGGGASGGTLNNCTLTGNSALEGGGTAGGTLNNCTLTANSAWFGGGADDSTLNNCTLTGNWAVAGGGGGAYFGTLNNCTLSGNLATNYGGGALGGTLNNCTLTGNSADYGGGASDGGLGGVCTLNNCIVYYNTAPNGGNYYGGTFNYCCTTPLPAGGAGNTDAEPQLVNASHLSANSPCLSRGSRAYASGLDIDGEPWATPPAIGCDEYWSGSVTGGISVAVAVSYTNVAVGFAVDFQALIGGRVSALRWDFADGVVVSNRPWASHAWGAAGEYVVELRAYNESYPAGIAVSVTVQVAENPVHYVALASANAVPPYSSWATAATNIQDAVDAATLPGALVLVTNGVYQIGARDVHGMSNRVAVTKPVTVRSLNGPAVTSIVGTGPNGSNAVRCVYMTNGAVLAGFTLTNGATQGSSVGVTGSGGGVWCSSLSAVVSNCVLTANSAIGYGGGAYSGTLNNCTLAGNSAAYCGGGAAWSTLNNCTLTGNSATNYGGGAFSATLNNCIVYYNTAPTDANYYYSCTLNYCCTTPMPAGTGSLTNAPLFVDTNGWSNLRLQTNSPCINAGLNAYAPGLTDLDGNPRIAGGRVDLGAYEFQGTGLSGFTTWLWQYGLPTDGSADYLDTDDDGHNNWQEWRCQTVPTNPLSVLRLLSASPAGTNVTVVWQSVAGVTYFLERSTNLSASPPFTLLAPNLSGQPGTSSFTDNNPAGAGPFFYRVGVGN